MQLQSHYISLKLLRKISWTQNLAIMETDLELDARYWYLLAVQRFGWSKAELTEKIAAEAHLGNLSEKGSQDHEGVETPRKHDDVKISFHGLLPKQ